MVRAEGLPLWAFDDPPARGARRDLRRGARPAPPTADRRARRGRHLRAHRRPRRLPRRARRRAGRGAPTSSSARSPSSPARWRPRSSACRPSASASPSRARRSACCPLVVDARRRAARAPSAWRPTRAARACSRRPYFTLMPAALEDPATPAGGCAAPLPRGAPRRAPPPGLRRPGRRAPARLRHLRLGRRRAWTSSRALYRAAIDALAGLPRAPARDRRARPRPGRPRAAAGQRARRALGAAGRPHAPRGGDGLPRRLGHRDDGPGRRRADGRRCRSSPTSRGTPSASTRWAPGSRSPAAREAVAGLREAVVRLIGDPVVPRRAPSGSPPRCARCRRSTPRSASCAGCSSSGSPHDRAY